MKLIILDREGVINQTLEGYVLEPRQWEPLPGSLDAIARLHHGGYRIAVATNQAALSRGLFDMAMLNTIHQRMCRLVESAGGKIDAIAVCPHSPEQNCNCRKPKPGMLLELIERFGATAAETSMVGDTLADIKAGLAAGCRTWLVRSGRAAQTVQTGAVEQGVVVLDDLAAVADRILSTAASDRQPGG